MSFTSTVKNEASKIETKHKEVELLAIINIYNDVDLKIITENNSVARRIYSLVKEICNINLKVTTRKGYNYNQKMIYILESTKKKDILKIIKQINIENDFEKIKSYLRGTFLMVGSINDPKTSRYHLEFLFQEQKEAKKVNKLLNQYNLNSKMLKRDNKYMVYIKEAEKIGDFLRIIGATHAVLYYEDIRIYRDHKNMTNRLNNCEQANIDKTIETASNQLKEIELIQENGGLNLLSEKEQIAAQYRIKYIDASLLELSEIISLETGQKISKSGLHHRFKKISELADRIRIKRK